MATSPARPAEVAALPHERLWNLPNTITILRTAIVPVLLFFPMFAASRAGSELLAWLFIVAALTDLLDGWLARRGQQVTRIGKLLDPLADKLLVATALIVLLAGGRIPAWGTPMVVVIIGRELAVTGLRNRAYNRGIAMPASSLGKIKMVAQVVAILALILGDVYLPQFLVIGRAALWIVVLLALVSAADYFRRFGGLLSARVTDISVARDERQSRKAG